MADCSAAFYEAAIKEFGPFVIHLKFLRGFLLVNMSEDVLHAVSTMAQTGRQTKTLTLLSRGSDYYYYYVITRATSNLILTTSLDNNTSLCASTFMYLKEKSIRGTKFNTFLSTELQSGRQLT